MTFYTSLMAGFELSSLPQQLVNGLLLGAIYALVALGYTMVYGVLKLINFAHGEVFMLGAYTALFTSWWLGFSPTAKSLPQANFWTILLMLVASMAVCGVVGVLIEFFAYRPMRDKPRISSLITAIGVSLLLQFGGALFLPVSPPPSIEQKASPLQGSVSGYLRAPDPSFTPKIAEWQKTYDDKKATYEAQLKKEADEYNLSAEGKRLRDEMQEADRALEQVRGMANKTAVQVQVPKGQLVMFLTTLVLMVMLWFIVMRTKAGKAMRAVSHDFDTASLMGINVNRTVTLTFVIGSALAGAGAMMIATFMGTPLTTQFGVLPGVKAFVAAVLGGIGNIPGAVLGGFLMGVAETLVTWADYSNYKDAVAFVILILVLMFRPGGLLGSSKVEKV